MGNLSKQPHLVVILVGNNPASQIYVKNKKLAAENIGIKSTIIELDSQIKETELLNKIEQLNNDSDVTGILVQLPLPAHIDKNKIVTTISPKKDVDGFTPENVGRLAIGLEPYFYPATPLSYFRPAGRRTRRRWTAPFPAASPITTFHFIVSFP